MVISAIMPARSKSYLQCTIVYHLLDYLPVQVCRAYFNLLNGLLFNKIMTKCQTRFPASCSEILMQDLHFVYFST